MNESIIIYLHADNLAMPSWAIVNAENQVLQNAWRDSPDGLSHIAVDRKIIVIVPAASVLLLKTDLPSMTERRLLQAIPFALEEQLIDEVDTLHFAIQQAAGTVYAAIVARSKMEEWLALLTSWQLKPDLLIPASLAIPFEMDKWHVVVADVVMMRTEKFIGFACDIENAATLLPIAISESKHPPAQLVLHKYTTDDIPLNINISCTEIKKTEQELIVDIAKTLDANVINLLQGQFAPKKNRFPQLNKLTKSLTYLASAWVLLLFLYPIVSFFLLHSRAKTIDTEISKIYHAYFPQSTMVVAPKLRLQEKLQSLVNGAGNSKALTLMGYVGKGLSQSSKVKLKKLDFQNNQLSLDVSATSSADIATFSDFLVTQGLVVKQQNASLAGARSNATLLVE